MTLEHPTYTSEMDYDVFKLANIIRRFEEKHSPSQPMLYSLMACLRLDIYDALRLEDPLFDPYGRWLRAAAPVDEETR